MLDRPSNLTETWTDERIETMRAMLAHGHSYGEIAAALGKPFTRNSCIGKAKRLGLVQAKRAKSLPPKAAGNRGVKPKRTPDQVTEDHRVRATLMHKRNGNAGKPKANAIVHRVLTRPTPAAEEAIDSGVDFTDRLGLMDVGRDDCRWIEGDPMTPLHTFCGKPVKPGTSWCPAHHARVYPPRT